MPPWLRLLDITINGLRRLQDAGHPVPDWVLGGGTALMMQAGHRVSKDVDAFITDPQYLALLSPRLAGETIWNCDAYQEAANHLRLVFSEGEIDFIVAAPITTLPTSLKSFVLERDGSNASGIVRVEHPVEIALKKLSYRGSALKVRDIFDIAVVNELHSDLLKESLHHVSHLKPTLLARLETVPDEFLHRELDELAIVGEWKETRETCLLRVRHLIEAIPK